MERRKISLYKLYQEKLKEPTPAQVFLNRLAKATNRRVITARIWINGKHKPEPIIQRIIADEFNLDVDYLFSDEDNNEASHTEPQNK